MKAAIAIVLVLSLVGCAGTVELGSLKIAGALMGAAGTGDTGNVAATWGNGWIQVNKTSSQIDRRGVSANLRGVLGDGLGLVVADKLLCAIPAVAAQCVLEKGVKRFVGDDGARAAAERLLE